MDENNIHPLIAMANMVYQSQACVLEVVITDNATIAHLIPREIWEDEGGDFSA